LGKRHDYGVDTGRLNTALTGAAQQIVYASYRDDRPDELGAELLVISEIDRAYLVMLAEEHIADVTAVRRMLLRIDELRGSRFAVLPP
jgi:argininosuccinate lyase